MSEPFLVGMTNAAKAALEKVQRQQGRFRYFLTNTDIDFGDAWGVALKVGSFRYAMRLTGRMRSYKGIADARKRLASEIRGAQFRKNQRHRRNKARHFGTGKVYHAFR